MNQLRLSRQPLHFLLAALLLLAALRYSQAHDHSLRKALKAREVALQKAAAQAESPADTQSRETCRLTIDLVDAEANKSVDGLVRITNFATGKAVRLNGEIHRAMNWYALPTSAVVDVPRTKLNIEAFHGLETTRKTRSIDLTGKETARLCIELPRFFNARKEGLRCGNTHLHLMKLTHAEADRYLRIVPKADDLDLVFLSHLRRIPDERHYISNVIVENSFGGGDLARLSKEGVLFGNGEEHRHNFGRGGEGYGHVMLLDILRLIKPVSIGPGIMRSGTDGIPLQSGIRQAREDGATAIWCHNTFGYEDIPNWMAGMLHAQNIFDGGNHGSYRDTFYRYLNLGMKIPFSTGTDWFVYDFSRVYVPIEGPLTTKKWLATLTAGKSTITNGPLLQLSVNDHTIGERVAMAENGDLRIQGRAIGRNDFRGLELIHNGETVHTVLSKSSEDHFTAEIDHELRIDGPGWVALRIPLQNNKNEFDKTLFAHTSPIYIECTGKRIFNESIAEELVDEIKRNIEIILEKGTFANETERESVLDVHRQGIEILSERIKEHNSGQGR